MPHENESNDFQCPYRSKSGSESCLIGILATCQPADVTMEILPQRKHINNGKSWLGNIFMREWYKTRSDVTECGVISGSSLLATHPAVF